MRHPQARATAGKIQAASPIDCINKSAVQAPVVPNRFAVVAPEAALSEGSVGLKLTSAAVIASAVMIKAIPMTSTARFCKNSVTLGGKIEPFRARFRELVAILASSSKSRDQAIKRLTSCF